MKEIMPTLNSKLTTNLISEIPDDELKIIGADIVEQVDQDEEDRSIWVENARQAYMLYTCDVSERTPRWEDGANFCMPMFTTAVNLYQGRIYLSIVNAKEHSIVLPVEPNDVDRAQRVTQYMNYQRANEIEGYYKSLESLILRTLIYGMCFRKIQWNPILKQQQFITISPYDLVVPSNTIDLETADRITYRYVLTPQALQAKLLSGEFTGIDPENIAGISVNSPEDLSDGRAVSNTFMGVEVNTSNKENDENDIFECHKKLKLLDDKELSPYTISVHKPTKTPMRITSRLLTNTNNNQVELKNFVAYGLFPNPEGFYDLGLHHMLKQPNEAVNMIYNQIFDAGTLSNIPFGFYTKQLGSRRRKNIKLHPGAMNEVNNPRDTYFPQLQRVDSTLFNLMNVTNQFSDKVVSTSDFMSGIEKPGSRTTATGTIALIEQGLQAYSVAAKRFYRGLGDEDKIQFTLNSIFLTKDKQYRISGDANKLKLPWPKINAKDFAGKLDLKIGVDPEFANQGLQIQKAVDFLNTVGQLPIIAGDKFGAQPNRLAQLEIAEELLKAFGKDPDRYNLTQNTERSEDPVVENNLMLQGQEVKTSSLDRDEIHHQVHTEYLFGDIGQTIKDQSIRDLFTNHIVEHTARAQIKIDESKGNQDESNFREPGTGEL